MRITLATVEQHLEMAEQVWLATQANIAPSRHHPDCIEVSLKGTKNTWDYPNKTFGGRKYQLRKIAYIIKHERLPEEGHDISHRCHNARCISPDHVVSEDNVINQTRKCCNMFLSNEAAPGYICPHGLAGLQACVPCKEE